MMRSARTHAYTDNDLIILTSFHFLFGYQRRPSTGPKIHTREGSRPPGLLVTFNSRVRLKRCGCSSHLEHFCVFVVFAGVLQE